MKKSMLYAIVISLAMSAGLAHAAKEEGAPGGACEGLKVATGPAGKGYSKMYKNIVSVGASEIALCEVNTEGGLDNLTTLSEKKADVGIVPIDALMQMSAGDSTIASLQVVASLNSNYVHIVVLDRGFNVAGPRKMGGMMAGDPRLVRITKLSELRGAPVALVGSAQLLVRQLDKALGLKMQYIDVASDKEAFKMVQDAKVYAAFSVAGWPHGEVKKLTQSSGLSLIPFDMPANAPYSVRPFSYKNIGVYNVQALSVQNLLVTRPFSGAKIAEVSKLKRVLDRQLSELKDGDFEPGWNEIKSLDAPVDWAKFQGVKVAAPEKTNRK